MIGASRSGYLGVGALTALAALAVAAPASATYPGTNGVVAYAAAVSANGGDIYTVNPDGSGARAITNSDADDYSPSFSADGERIVFERRPAGMGSLTEIWVMNPDGSGQTRVASGTADTRIVEPSFSPDGATIVYTVLDGPTSTANVWAMNADGSGQRPLTQVPSPMDVSNPVYSPAGSKIAVTYQSAGFTRIATMNPDGSGLLGVSAPTPGGSSQPDWSPDGTKLIFRDNRSIVQTDANGLNPVQLTSSAGPPYDSGPVFSPQGSQFAFNRQGASSTGEVRLGTAGAALSPTTTLAPSSGGAGAGGSLSWQSLNPPSCSVGAPKPAKSGKTIAVEVSCANENATVFVEGSGKAPKSKRFSIPAVTAEVPSGGSAEVQVAVPKKGAKAIKKATKRGKKAKATLNVLFVDGLGASVADTAKVKFKPKKRGK